MEEMTSIDYKWVKLVPATKYPVWENGKIMIPKGTPDVECAYHQSSKTYVDRATGKTLNQNVYRWNNVVYNV